MWRQIIRMFLLTGVLGALCVGGMTKIEETSLQQGIASSVIRFHVLADSDSAEDQRIKIQVKDRIVSYMEPILKNARTVEESREKILMHLDNVEKAAKEVLEGQGVADQVCAGLERVWFPQKVYGDCTFPAGVYEALQIKIGKASGHNWWCVLYPGLCFENSIQGVVTKEGKQKLNHVLTEEEMECVLNEGKVKISFRWFS
ncbi:MAG: stage II sporulation protein R [Ruminococcus sp.]|jgi:stage II sporulation protein R